MKKFLQALERFDRRWIFLAMALAIVVPMFFPMNLPVATSPMVEAAFQTVSRLKKGDKVVMAMDFDPASTPELAPFFQAVTLQLKRQGVRIVYVSTWYASPPLVEQWIREFVDIPIVSSGVDDGSGYTGEPDRGYERNTDYAWLGYREGKEAFIAAMGDNVVHAFDGIDAFGTPIEKIDVMQGIKGLADFDLVVLVSAGYPGVKEYVQQVQVRYKLPIVAACTAVSTTDYTPYFQSGQLLGLVGGLAASAEYEKLVGRPGFGMQGADVLNIAHLVVILAIVFGNIIFFAGRRFL